MSGVVRTRVGYAGGSKDNPTYRNLGNHTETLQIEYDPSQVSYAELLDVFWNNHNPTTPSYSRQYASIIFYHNETQKALAEQAKAQEEAKRGEKIVTEIVPAAEFYSAEDYHQKYRLQNAPTLMHDLRAIYPAHEDFVDSTAAARINGYIAGYGTCEQLQGELDDLGLSSEGQERIEEIVCR